MPPDLRAAVQQAQIVITNYHAFLLRDAKEIQGVAANTQQDPARRQGRRTRSRRPREADGGPGPARLRAAGQASEIVVFNDEAHHCYQDKPIADA